jgi:Endodeoxyribonuclease RusA.
MAKRKLKIHFRIPKYDAPRNQWRRLIYDAACTAMQAQHVVYQPNDFLAVSLVLYLDGSALGIHDVDNRLKDVLDALQGRIGGPKIVRQCEPLIANDRQIYRVTVSKMLPPRQSRALGHVTISRCTEQSFAR